MPELTSPLTLRTVQIKNRLVMPPMVLFKKEGTWKPDASHLEYYARRARAGVGLIIVEATSVSPEGRLAPFQLRAWDDAHVEALAPIARAIKTSGAVALIQLHHAGANTHLAATEGATLVSPSGVPVNKTESARRALTPEEICALVACFAAAAQRCIQAGFDGVELHGAHGYLLSQFLSPLTNRRTDGWGGPTVRERLAFPLAVARAVRGVIGPRPLLGYRLGIADYAAGGLPLAEGIEAAGILAGTGYLDLLHVSNGLSGVHRPLPPADFEFSQLLWLGAQAKAAVDLPVIAVGGIRTGAEARRVLSRNHADLVAVGKAMLADPDWPAKALAGQDDAIRTCLICPRCAHFEPERRCAAWGT
ncbi:MAG: hypothetical protein ACM3ZC_11260 [Bacteroidota bacterium]